MTKRQTTLYANIFTDTDSSVYQFIMAVMYNPYDLVHGIEHLSDYGFFNNQEDAIEQIIENWHEPDDCLKSDYVNTAVIEISRTPVNRDNVAATQYTVTPYLADFSQHAKETVQDALYDEKHRNQCVIALRAGFTP